MPFRTHVRDGAAYPAAWRISDWANRLNPDSVYGAGNVRALPGGGLRLLLTPDGAGDISTSGEIRTQAAGPRTGLWTWEMDVSGGGMPKGTVKGAFVRGENPDGTIIEFDIEFVERAWRLGLAADGSADVKLTTHVFDEQGARIGFEQVYADLPFNPARRGFHTYSTRVEGDGVTWFADGQRIGHMDARDTEGHWQTGPMWAFATNWNVQKGTWWTGGDVFDAELPTWLDIRAASGPGWSSNMGRLRTGSGAADTLTGGDWDDLLAGKVGNDRLAGKGGTDDLRGGNGADRIYGGGGGDIIDGGSGRDTIRGGLGADYLWGGEGVDTFVFYEGEGGRREIMDYQRGVDIIEVRMPAEPQHNDMVLI